MSSLYSIDLMKELSDGFEEDGFTPAEVKSFLSRGRLREFRGVIRGTHEIRLIDHLIDLAVPCKLPFDGAERVSPAKSGAVKLERLGDDLYLDRKKIELVLSERQKGSVIVGHELRIEREKVGGNLSAKILDHLEAHPELWPESWKKDDQGNTIYVFFWGDIFRGAHGNLFVRYGSWVCGRVASLYIPLGGYWGRYSPAASVAS